MAKHDGNSEFGEEQFIRRFAASQRALRAYIVGLCPPAADADDILQEVNLALWRKRDLYDCHEEFLRWAFGFALMEVRRARSKTARQLVWFAPETIEALTASMPVDAAMSNQRRDALADCIEKLGPTEKQVITEYYKSRVPARDLAEKLSRPLSTVYKVLNRARESLRLCVQATLAQANHPTEGYPAK
jgi:RNA polymerase sigma-70 factor (ECF subfamily)